MVANGYNPDVYGEHIHAQLDNNAHVNQVNIAQNIIERISELKTGFVVRDRVFLNVGTGNDSIALMNLGAKRVDLFNSSASELARFRSIFADHPSRPGIAPRVLDLVEEDLPHASYDGGFVNGVVHHTANVRATVSNLLQSMKPGAMLYISVYRRGGFRWLVAQMMRALNFLPSDEVSRFAAAQVEKGAPQQLALIFCDDLLCNHMWLFDYQDYRALFKELDVGRWVIFGDTRLPYQPLRMPNFMGFVLAAGERAPPIDVSTGPCAPSGQVDLLRPENHRTEVGRALTEAFTRSPLRGLADSEGMLEKLLELSLLTALGYSSEAGWARRNDILIEALSHQRPVHKDVLLQAYTRAIAARRRFALS